ncbi:hypothetical protein ABFV83_09745 [Lacrimispora sp. BS-2]|uniref:Glycosyl hydrolase n=1 Tax=Lacrimispora sp. BS-2 TaxID=3151850 RepID=A0AAU7PUS9_9FIRM
MKRGIKFSLCTLGSGIGLAVVGWGLVCILQHYGLMLRAWVGITFFVIIALLGFALSGGIIYTLTKVYSRPKEGILRKIVSATGIVIILLGTGAFVILALFGAAFGYNPEHVVEKYGQKMVSYDRSYLDTNIEYYEYINFLVCGNKVIGNEGPKQNYWFQDFQGNLIASYEEDFALLEITDKIAISFPPEEMKCTFDGSDTRSRSVMSYSVDGENWEERDTGYHYQFFFGDIGYLVVSYDWAMQHEAAAVYRSVDRGEHWSFISATPSDTLLQNVMFFDEDTGVFEYGEVGTDSYALYTTMDGGSTFMKVNLPAETQVFVWWRKRESNP